MRIAVARLRAAAAIAERVELFDIAKVRARLRLHPFAQADLERAVRERIERAGRQRRLLRAARLRHEDAAVRRPPARRWRR